MKKIIYISLGCISMGIGAVGAAVPLLPTLPFLMLSAFCFARSSQRLDRWFQSTRLYQENLADLASGKGMTRAAKLRVTVTATLLMGIGFFIMGMKGIFTGCAALFCIWVIHLLYFIFAIKTIHAKEAVTP